MTKQTTTDRDGPLPDSIRLRPGASSEVVRPDPALAKALTDLTRAHAELIALVGTLASMQYLVIESPAKPDDAQD